MFSMCWHTVHRHLNQIDEATWLRRLWLQLNMQESERASEQSYMESKARNRAEYIGRWFKFFD